MGISSWSNVTAGGNQSTGRKPVEDVSRKLHSAAMEQR